MAKFYGEVDSVRGNSVHRLGHSETTEGEIPHQHIICCVVEWSLYIACGAAWGAILFILAISAVR